MCKQEFLRFWMEKSSSSFNGCRSSIERKRQSNWSHIYDWLIKLNKIYRLGQWLTYLLHMPNRCSILQPISMPMWYHALLHFPSNEYKFHRLLFWLPGGICSFEPAINRIQSLFSWLFRLLFDFYFFSTYKKKWFSPENLICLKHKCRAFVGMASGRVFSVMNATQVVVHDAVYSIFVNFFFVTCLLTRLTFRVHP